MYLEQFQPKDIVYVSLCTIVITQNVLLIVIISTVSHNNVPEPVKTSVRYEVKTVNYYLASGVIDSQLIEHVLFTLYYIITHTILQQQSSSG
jgi:hypothetical protein